MYKNHRAHPPGPSQTFAVDQRNTFGGEKSALGTIRPIRRGKTDLDLWWIA